ncbi:hypothetical protein [Alicyclobacillus sp. ALC3]|uniref:hypothetical protein n=1 Tax=Alicyclobacillus sp. ALC3 TaxID=2796143 RepID=UPI0023784314|nr:hypothetical protein [Alicyclobacillus sp. ALC3]WDL96371.1 hypothetical protein JC200_18905 [Alicyclobacillus sp. ALC3]
MSVIKTLTIAEAISKEENGHIHLHGLHPNCIILTRTPQEGVPTLINLSLLVGCIAYDARDLSPISIEVVSPNGTPMGHTRLDNVEKFEGKTVHGAIPSMTHIDMVGFPVELIGTYRFDVKVGQESASVDLLITATVEA